TWFWGLGPTNGAWLLQGAVNGSSSDSYVYQRVSGLKPGVDCTFSAWLMTAHRENGTYKYDVWQERNRISYMRLGIDPTGGTNVNAATVHWTPRMYSHRRYTQLAKTVLAQSSNVTVFVTMKGQGGEWHLYAVDGCTLTQQEIPTQLVQSLVSSNGFFQATVAGRMNRSNIVEASTNLASWAPITNFVNQTGATPFHDPVANRRFYRARTLP
ncbi:MAG: hypothetical protein L0Z53_10230, partial [Acidobacteriales bacterium]|nr:hypothetical protein [Terriglobales bacterium]